MKRKFIGEIKSFILEYRVNQLIKKVIKIKGYDETTDYKYNEFQQFGDKETTLLFLNKEFSIWYDNKKRRFDLLYDDKERIIRLFHFTRVKELIDFIKEVF